MTQKILWTVWDDDRKCHAMAIAVYEFFGICQTTNFEDRTHVREFPAREEACRFITEANKSVYYEAYGLSYKLEYVEPDSAAWVDAREKFEILLEIHKDFVEYVNRPWYKRLFHKPVSKVLEARINVVGRRAAG